MSTDNESEREDKHRATGIATALVEHFIYCGSVPDAERAAAIREVFELAKSRAGAHAFLLEMPMSGLTLRSTIAGLRALKPCRSARPTLRLLPGGLP